MPRDRNSGQRATSVGSRGGLPQPRAASSTSTRCSAASTSASSRCSSSSRVRKYPTANWEDPHTAKVDRLSVYLRRVCAEWSASSHSPRPPHSPRMAVDRSPHQEKRAQQLVTEVLREVFTTSIHFMSYFEFSLPKLLKKPESFLDRVHHNVFDCRLFIKDFEVPNTCQVKSGSQEDVPPGVALYKLSNHLTNEEKRSIRSYWGGCMDEEGYMSPTLMFPWFAEGIGSAVNRIQQRKENSDKEVDKKPNEEKEEEDKPTMTLYFSVPTMVLVVEGTPEDTFFINFVPTIRGKGWPRGTKLQHALPKQKPFCAKGQAALNKIESRMADGYSMWYLEARPVHLPQNVIKSARFRKGIRHLRYPERFWTFSFAPTEKILYDNMSDACRSHEYSFDIEELKKLCLTLATYHAWSKSHFSSYQMNAIIMWAIKRNLGNIRSIGEAFVKIADSIHVSFAQKQCPHFLMPNINLLESLNSEESSRVASEIKCLLNKLEENPASILVYAGYE